MNFIFISPHFPHTYWNFCDRLKQNGVNVLGIGDAAYETLEEPLRRSLTEYYRVDNMSDYDQMFRAVAFFSFKYGRIDWIESMNEYWLEQDARLRTDFNIRTGVQLDQIDLIKEKSEMKLRYLEAGIPTARQFVVSAYGSLTEKKSIAMNPDGTAADGTPLVVSTLSDAEAFLHETGYPVIVKPNIGVGATNTWKLENEEELRRFYEKLPTVPYVMEEFIEGDICSYDAILDSHCDPLFESMTVWPPSVMDIVLKDLDLMYYTCPTVPEKLRMLGRKTVKAFGVKSRFVHLEFFRLTKARKGLGEVGDFVALEVNMRPAGGYTPDMMNFAHSCDVYKIWADMVTTDRRFLAGRLQSSAELGKHTGGEGTECFCVYASRKDGHHYLHTEEEILAKYGSDLVMQEEMPEMNWPQMGRYMYTVKLRTQREVTGFIRFVQQQKK